MKPRGITVCVDYDDLLQLTLPQNLQFVSEQWVVTSPTDDRTQKLLRDKFPAVKVFVTDAFTRYGASFNKGLAMEEAFTAMGRDGWILIWDADTVFESRLFSGFVGVARFSKDILYGCRRLILTDPTIYEADPAAAWRQAVRTDDTDIPGYFQLFNAAAPQLKGREFWYDPTFAHAGGGDAYFHSLWSVKRKRRLPILVLHLGPRDCNWFGRVSARVDGGDVAGEGRQEVELAALRKFQGWRDIHRGKHKNADGKVLDRVSVPGVKSTYVWGRSKPPEQ